MSRKHTLPALLLAMALTGALPAAAATTFSGQQNGNSATFSVQDDKGGVYAAQVELTLKGSYQSASFQSSQPGAYTTCTTTTSNGNTQVTFYITSSTPLNNGSPLGTLTMDKSFSLPATANLTLLDRGSSPIISDQSMKISTGSGGSSGGGNSGSSGGNGGNGGNGGSSEESEKYAVQVDVTVNGIVTANYQEAKQGNGVTLTVKPDTGYKLDTLTVTTKDGRSVTLKQQGTRYTFIMPNTEVTVSASFVPTGAVEPTPTSKPLPFTDVAENQWYTDAIRYVYEQGMMNGVSANGDLFAPEATTTRGMIVTMLHRMEGTPVAQSASYPDVPENEWYTNAVAWASANGIVTGYDSGAFGPADSITREQMAAILYRYAQKKGYQTQKTDPLTSFTDAGTVSSYAVQGMQWAVGSGLITGKGQGILDPGGSATRAEVAAILTRFCQNIAAS